MLTLGPEVKPPSAVQMLLSLDRETLHRDRMMFVLQPCWGTGVTSGVSPLKEEAGVIGRMLTGCAVSLPAGSYVQEAEGSFSSYFSKTLRNIFQIKGRSL